jgi:lysophospholipase L1-like esterase
MGLKDFMKIRFLQHVFLIILFSAHAFLQIYAQQVIRILPLGNSITEGYTDGSLTDAKMRGYRYGLRYLLQHADYDIDMVGSESNGSDYFTDSQHGGIGGTRDQYLVRLLTDGYDERNDLQILVPPRPYLDEYNPDIILLHIGTNDITHEGSAAITNQKISEILNLVDQYETRAGKEVIVFLALIINRKKPWTAGSPAEITTSFNNSIKSLAQTRIANGDKIVIVDMEHEAGFLYTSEDMADDGEGLHPNDLGYSRMANLWFNSIRTNFNTNPEISGIPNQTIAEEGNFSTISLDDYVWDIEDPDSGIVWTAFQTGTSYLNITFNASRQAEIIPKDKEWNGSQTVIFKATDRGMNGKYVKYASDTVIFTVTPVNDAPVITSTASPDAYPGEPYTYTFTATDADNPTLFKTAVQIPSWLSFSEASGALTGIPYEADKGPNPVILRAYDGLLATDQSYTLTVHGESVLEDQENAIIRIFPLPAKDFLRVKVPDIKTGARLEIINAMGITVKIIHIPACDGSIEFDLNGIESGTYFLHVFNNRVNYIHRFAVIR